MKNAKRKFLVTLGMAVCVGLFSAATLLAEEIRQSIRGESFVPQLLPTGQNFEVFRFDLPEIPQGSRIDFAGLFFHIQRDTVRNRYLSLELMPITSDWTPISIRNGQVLSVYDTLPFYALADVNREDKAEMDITQLVSAWQKGERANHGFYLSPETSEDETKFSVKSNGGVKMELVIYYTGPEVKK